jgi:hypothetical protein
MILSLQHIEAACGIELLYRAIPVLGPFDFVRRPGTSPDAAAAAVNRLARVRDLPGAQDFAAFVVAHSVLFILLAVSLVLSAWLPFQWIPA